jgi:hypothetical protein
MKKLLVLMVVLAVASLANAVIVSSIKIVDNLDGTYAISLPDGMSNAVDGPSGGYVALVGIDMTSGTLTAPVMMDASALNRDFGSGEDWIGLGPGIIAGFVTNNTTTTWTSASGVYATGLTPLAGVTLLELWQLDDGFIPMGTEPVDTMIIPEPATIALLCIGGLLLRKKK